MANITFTAGRLLCGKVRNFLDQCKFKGMDIDYIESSGWIERDFMVKGSYEDMLSIHELLKIWSDKLENKGNYQ